MQVAIQQPEERPQRKSQRRRVAAVILLLLVAVFVCLFVWRHSARRTQASARLDVKVTDATGAAIPGATVTVNQNGASSVLSAKTNNDGVANFQDLDPGSASINASAAGFNKSHVDVILKDSSEVSTSTVLGVSSSSQTVEVTANYPDRSPASVHPPRNQPATSGIGQDSVKWNSWIEPALEVPKFRPLGVLPMDADVEVYLDLSLLSYDLGGGAFQKDADKDVVDALRNLHSDVTLKILAITDHDSFLAGVPSDREASLTVKYDRWSRRQQIRSKMLGTAMHALQRNPDADFVLGRSRFKLHTTNRKGAGSLALLVWQNGKPIDEMTFPICVGTSLDDCKGHPLQAFDLRGASSISSLNRDMLPDAAIQIVDLASSGLVGVFKCNTCSADDPSSKFVTWYSDQSSQSLKDYLEKTILPAFENASTDDDYLTHGHDLYFRLFQQQGSADLPEASDRFRAFVLGNAGARDDRPKTLFVRMLPQDPLFLFPLGLMALPDQDVYVGQRVTIETPLPRQTFAASAECISNWHLLVPPAGEISSSEMQAVRKPFEGWVNNFAGWTNHSTIDSDIPTFQHWLSDSKAAPTSTAIVMLSHHDSNAVFFDETKERIASASVQRPFGDSSLVVLNGCGTAKPSSSDFIDMFNRHGVQAVVATSFQVEPTLAGLFASQLMTHLSSSSSPTYGVANATHDAIIDVSQMPLGDGSNKNYGPRALVFVFAGDAAIRACPAPSVPKTVPITQSSSVLPTGSSK